MHVPLIDRWSGAAFARWPALGPWLADKETAALGGADALPPVRSPVYVTGLARAGSTLLLEILHASGEFACHRYSDFPLIWTPYWWNYLLKRLPTPPVTPSERAHGDRILVTRSSPEAFEEMLWQHFFPHAEQGPASDLLGAAVSCATFERVHRQHLQKLQWVHGRARYLAKANGHIPRLGYLHRLYPDARFVIPVRDPLEHVASLVRQDAKFCAWSAQSPDVGGHLLRTGHREFGPGKRAMRLASDAEADAINADFQAGRVVQGFARQWASLHGWLLNRLVAEPELRAACLLVEQNRLCRNPREHIEAIALHAGLQPGAAADLADSQSPRVVAAPASQLDPSDRARVESLTGEVWAGLTALAQC